MPFALVAAVGCAAPRSAPSAPPVPLFTGAETEIWSIQDLGPIDRDDLLPAFAASAEAYGCSTDQIGHDVTFNIHGERHAYYGINAACREGTLALVTLVGTVRLGCAKPLTPQSCDALLRRISDAR